MLNLKIPTGTILAMPKKHTLVHLALLINKPLKATILIQRRKLLVKALAPILTVLDAWVTWQHTNEKRANVAQNTVLARVR
jgi:hypothetical protein